MLNYKIHILWRHANGFCVWDSNVSRCDYDGEGSKNNEIRMGIYDYPSIPGRLPRRELFFHSNVECRQAVLEHRLIKASSLISDP